MVGNNSCQETEGKVRSHKSFVRVYGLANIPFSLNKNAFTNRTKAAKYRHIGMVPFLGSHVQQEGTVRGGLSTASTRPTWPVHCPIIHKDERYHTPVFRVVQVTRNVALHGLVQECAGCISNWTRSHWVENQPTQQTPWRVFGIPRKMSVCGASPEYEIWFGSTAIDRLGQLHATRRARSRVKRKRSRTVHVCIAHHA